MKKSLVAFFLGLLILTGCNGGEEQDVNDVEETQEETNGNEESSVVIDSEQAVSIAEQFIGHLSSEEYNEASGYLNDTMAAELGAAELQELWETLESQIGAFIDEEFHTTQEVEDYLVVLMNGLFEGADVMFTITLDTDYKIAGFFVQ